jgi:hypothetical protein
MGNRHLRKICEFCGKYRNLAWDIEKKSCYDCLKKNELNVRFYTGVKIQ